MAMLGHSMKQLIGVDEVVAAPGFEIISTLAYSHGMPRNPAVPDEEVDEAPQCYLLQHAIDRLLLAAKELKWTNVVSSLSSPKAHQVLLREIESHLRWEHVDPTAPDRLFIVRVSFKADGQLTLMSGQRPIVPAIPMYPTTLPLPNKKMSKQVPIVPVYVDHGFMVPSLLTRHKTTFRQPYSEARARVGLHPTTPFTQGEVLLVNTEGEVMDGGFTTVYFWRQHDCGVWGWRTPREESGAKLGVSRRWALERAGVTEGLIVVKDVVDGERVWLSSAAGGFVRGKITFERHMEDSSTSDAGV